MIAILVFVSLAGIALSDDHKDCINVARMGRATANNMDRGKSPWKANDGNIAGKMIMGSVYRSAWLKDNKWALFLNGSEAGVQYPVNMVTIWPRKDKDSEGISGAKVWVGDRMCGQVEYKEESSYHPVKVMCPEGTKGGVVAIEQLNGRLELAEVQVWVKKDMIPVIPKYWNVALKKPAMQSKTLRNAVAGRAVDGNANKWITGNSCSTTNAATNRWWAVDLKGTYDISNVIIHNRIDRGLSERLNGAKVYVRNGAEDQLCGTVQYKKTDVAVYHMMCQLTGDKVWIKAGDKILTLCEVQVIVVEKEEEGTEEMDEEM